LALALILLGFTMAKAGVSIKINIGLGDYYNPVGDYDYLPYAYETNPGFAAPRINFYDMMSQYGIWVTVAPFGRVWKPYASNDWRPYSYGHWIYTQQYGQMWEGYEPWAWAGYHYGNWIFDRNYGWVWIPGYDWHPGRVTWARSYGSIGWMPAPPMGYDYSRGYLSNVGPDNQFAYNDDDFGVEYDVGNYRYSGPYYDPRYREMYYNPSYNQININLWVFIDNNHYGYDNYSDYYLGRDYTRRAFDRRMVRISNRPIDRPVLERLIGRRVIETKVQIRQFQTDKQAIRVVVPIGSNDMERMRKNSRVVVRDIIAPGFAEKHQQFKGQNSRNKEVVSRIFHQENVKPKIETLTTEQINNQAGKARQNRELSRKKIEQVQQEKLIRIEKEGKVQEPKKEQVHQQQLKNQKDQERKKEQSHQQSEDKTVKAKDKKKKQQEEKQQHPPKEQ
jgi:Family of unknown function (DUF6600)